MSKAIKTGLTAFAFVSYFIFIGIPGRIGVPAALPMLAVVAGLFFWLNLSRAPAEDRPIRILRAGLLAGMTTGLLVALKSGLFATLLGNGVSIQPVFDKIVPLNIAALLGVQPGAIVQAQVALLRYLVQIIYFTGSGVLGALVVVVSRSHVISSGHPYPAPDRTVQAGRWLVIALPFIVLAIIIYLGLPNVKLFGTNRSTVRLLLTLVTTGSGLFALRMTRPGRERMIVAMLLGIGVLTMPFILDQFQNSVMGIVFIFVMMGLGLNIVVGYAGLLDLGYVAFFAMGAYTYAFISAPFSSPLIRSVLLGWGISPESPLLGYWMALPLTMVAAAIGGVLLGIPVLRLRGDYLAIVTLGFGEIFRLFMLNLGELTNGPRGILAISQPRLFGLTPDAFSGGRLSSQGWIFLLALLGSALVAFIAMRLNDSRLGRAWVAMREDEDVAQATGVHLVHTKLLAFAIGATFAGLAGQLYAARQINIFPENFSLFVSIDALALIIVGGMGSLPGVVFGALALKGLPEVLRGVDEYRIVTFSALLVIMMIVRPEGILPSTRRRLEIQLAEQSEAGADLLGPEKRSKDPVEGRA